MARYPRITGKVFGRTASASGDDPQIGEFGSALTGQYNGTGDVSVIQGNSAWDNGFISCVTPTNQYPPLPEMTGFGKVLSQQICYLLQQGVAEYDSGTEYYTGNWCSYNGSLYIAKSDGFSNKLPTNTTYWSKFTGASPRNLGEIVTSSLPLTDGTLHLADGSLLSATDYPEFVNYVASLYNSLPTTDFSVASQILSNSTWNGIAYGAGKYVAVNSSGNFTTSEDGENWDTPAKMVSDVSNTTGITYGDNKFICITTSGRVLTSSNGTSWSEVGSSPLGSGNWTNLAYGNGKFIAINGFGTLAISQDGTNWYSLSPTGATIQGGGICFGNGLFVSIGGTYGKICYSTDGVNWTQATTISASGSGIWVNATYNGEEFIALSANGFISTSEDGITWTTPVQNVNLGSNSWTNIAYGGLKTIAIGTTGYISTKEAPFTYVFATEADWQATYTTYGECGKYVYNSTNNTVRIPLYSTYLTNTVNPQKLGNLTEASIPNIKGVISANEKLYKSGTSVSDYGAFNNVQQNVVSGLSDNSHFDNDLWDFDASRVSNVYSDAATTVNTQSIKQLVYIVVAK